MQRAPGTGGRQPRAGGRLVGRDLELRELAGGLREARRGDGGALLIEGAAGIGKTGLLDVACELAGKGGFTVLRARGSELEREFPFGVVRQLLVRTVVAEGGEELFAGAAALARTVIEPSPQLGSAPGYPVLHGLYWLVTNLAERGPVVLAVDDLHWADAESIGLVLFLAARLEGVRVLLLLATRELGGEEAPAALGALSDDPNTRLLTLCPLSLQASSRLLSRALGAEAPRALGEACHEAAGGKPFLLGELAVELRKGDGAATDPGSVRDMAPRTIVRAVLARLDRLPQGAPALAEAAAVLGDGVELRQAATLAGLEGESCGALADALAGAGILAPGRPLRFAHPLLRSAVEGTLSAGELAAAHGRAARLLAAEGAGPEAVASQLLATEPGAEDWTITALREASGAALGRAAPASSRAYLRRALRERCDGELRAELLLELGLAAFHGGGPDAIELLRDAAALAQAPELRMRIAFVLVPALGWAARFEEAAEVLNGAASASESAADALRGMRLLSALGSVGGRRGAVEEVKRTIPVAMELRERAPRLLLVVAAHELAASEGTAAQTNEVADLALGDGRLLAEQPGNSPFLILAICPYYATGAFAAAERVLDEGLGNARSRGAAGAVGQLLMFRAAVRMYQGDLARAEFDARQGLELAGGERSYLAPIAVGTLVEIELARGRLEDAARAVDLLSPDLREPGSVLFQVWRIACAELCLAQGRLEDAIGHLEAVAAWERDWGADNGVWCPWRPRAARAHASLGDAQRAEELSARALVDARRFGATHPIGLALMARAEVLEPERVALLEEAAHRLRDSDSRLLYASALAALGGARRAAGDSQGARATLAEAITFAQQLGATGIERGALSELVDAGGKPRQARTAGPLALTPAELQTAELATQGLKNRQIAQAQFVTAKTVETHLSSAYRKLGIRSRAQLAGALAGAQLEAI